jgi:chromosome segregation ATPase
MQRREPTLDGASATLETQLERAPIGRSFREPAREPVEIRSGGSSTLAVVALILALAGLGGAAFLYQQWQISRVSLVDAESRIAELEKRFEMSGEESAASVEVLGVKVKENAVEVRKLWGVAYDTNRKNIATNAEAIASQKKTLASLSGQVSGMSASVKKIAAVETALAELRQSNTQSDRQLKDQVAGLERQLASVRSDLTARVGANEEAIESVDAYRRSVNKDLVQLRDAIRSLQSGSSTASAP